MLSLFLAEITASELGQYVANGCNLHYKNSQLQVSLNPKIRGQIVEQIICEIIRSLFFKTQSEISAITTPHQSNLTKYIDRVLAKYYVRLQNYTNNQLILLKKYLLMIVSKLKLNELQILVLGTNYPQLTDNKSFYTQKIIRDKIAGISVIAKVDVWIRIGGQIIIGEIKDRYWDYPFPNIGDLVQTLLASQIAFQKGLKIRYNWIYYAPMHSYHCFGYLPQLKTLITETLVQYKHSMPANSDAWCKFLYQTSCNIIGRE